MGVLYTVLMFIVAISILVAVHEFGHYWVARRLGVKVLRFSIGMGKPLLIKRAGADQTEYVISALPLGGYVKMLGEHDDDVPEHERHRAFNRQPVWKRMAIVSAGPLFNFLFAILAYWVLYVTGVSGIRPVIGEIIPESAAARAGLQSQMEIVGINGKNTPSWEEVLMQMLPAAVDKQAISLTARSNQSYESTYQLDFSSLDLDRDLQDPFKAAGFTPYRIPIPPVIDGVEPGKPAEKAGLQKGDRILKINDHEVKDFLDIAPYLQTHCKESVTVTFERAGEIRTVNIDNYIDSKHGMARYVLGINKDLSAYVLPESYRVNYSLSPWQAIHRSMERTADLSVMSLKLLWKIVTLEFSFRNVGSVIQIANAAGRSASMGFERFLVFLALVSISLGIMNLLPIPILDGGHLLFYIVESVTGRPVSERVEVIGQKIGMFLLMMLMMLAFYNDIMRMFVPEECPRF